MADYIVPVVVALIAVVPGIAMLVAGRAKNKADAASALTGAAMQIVNELQDELKRTREELTAVQAELKETRNELRKAVAAQLEQSVLVSTMRDTIEQFKAENATLRERTNHAEQMVDELKKELAVERGRVTRLRNQLQKAGFKPDTGELEQ